MASDFIIIVLRGEFYTIFLNVLIVSSENTWSVCWKYVESMLKVYWKYVESILKVYWKYGKFQNDRGN